MLVGERCYGRKLSPVKWVESTEERRVYTFNQVVTRTTTWGKSALGRGHQGKGPELGGRAGCVQGAIGQGEIKADHPGPVGHCQVFSFYYK